MEKQQHEKRVFTAHENQTLDTTAAKEVSLIFEHLVQTLKDHHLLFHTDGVSLMELSVRIAEMSPPPIIYKVSDPRFFADSKGTLTYTGTPEAQ